VRHRHDKKNERFVEVVEDEVPTHLRKLISTARNWGFWNPHVCDDVIESTSTEELRIFVREIEADRKAIDDWLDTLPKEMKKWPTAAETFLCLIRNWREAACELNARDNHSNAEPKVAPDCGGIPGWGRRRASEVMAASRASASHFYAELRVTASFQYATT
jgi:hypothetical protein